MMFKYELKGPLQVEAHDVQVGVEGSPVQVEAHVVQVGVEVSTTGRSS